MSSPETGSVIHDIGFRHYDGVRLGRRWAVRSLFAETLRGFFGIGRPASAKVVTWIVIGLVVVPALVMAIIVFVAKLSEPVTTSAAYPLGGGIPFLLAMLLAGRAPDAVSRDLREGVMPLYFSRPLKRSDYVFARLGGVALGLFLVTATAQTLLFIGALLAELPLGTHLGNWALGLVVAAVLSALLAMIAVLLAAITPRRGFGAAAIMTTFILAGSMGGILGYLADDQGSGMLSLWLFTIDPFTLVDVATSSLLGIDRAIQIGDEIGAGTGAVFAVWLLTLIGLGLILLLRRYRKVSGI